MPKVVMFKCGKCGSNFNVDESNILNLTYPRKCPNCAQKVPDYLHNKVYQLLEAVNSKDVNWDVSVTTKQQ